MIKHLCALIFLLLLWVGCSYNRYESMPPASNEPWIATRTIGELVQGDVKGEVVVRAVVVTSDSTGNFYKEILVRDSDQGAALGVRVALYSTYALYPIGSTIALRLTGTQLDYDQGMLSVSLPGSFGALSHYIQHQGVERPLTWHSSTLTKLDSLPSGSLVELPDVHFPAAGSATYSGSVKLRQLLSSGPDGDISATLYTSPYATFASAPLPSGVWRLRAIVVRHEDQVQLRFASSPDLLR